jgi:hypothetical protein
MPASPTRSVLFCRPRLPARHRTVFDTHRAGPAPAAGPPARWLDS